MLTSKRCCKCGNVTKCQEHEKGRRVTRGDASPRVGMAAANVALTGMEERIEELLEWEEEKMGYKV